MLLDFSVYIVYNSEPSPKSDRIGTCVKVKQMSLPFSLCFSLTPSISLSLHLCLFLFLFLFLFLSLSFSFSVRPLNH